jgi:hypothetical protein
MSTQDLRELCDEEGISMYDAREVLRAIKQRKDREARKQSKRYPNDDDRSDFKIW